MPTKTLAAAGVAWACLIAMAAPSRGDEFARLDGPFFFDLTTRPDAHAHAHLTVRALEALPAVLSDERANLVMVKTDQGNLAKILVSAGMRKLKPAEQSGPVVPVLIMERFETIDASDRRSQKAHGKELTLFDGFAFDLDTGQVVPEGSGGDIVFFTQGPDGPRLAAIHGPQLYTLEKPINFPAAAAGKPSSGRAILPGDFAGRYSLMANGQWSGTLELAVDSAGAIAGHFRSDRNGSAYPVTGQVDAEIPHKVAFSVQFPRARQLYEGLLWTEGKNAIAGSLSMLDRPYSFVAIREGASFGADTIDMATTLSVREKSRRRVVRLEAGSDQFALDGQPRSQAELTTTLARAVKAEPATAVLLRVSGSITMERVQRAAETIRAAGVNDIQLAPATEGDSN